MKSLAQEHIVELAAEEMLIIRQTSIDSGGCVSPPCSVVLSFFFPVLVFSPPVRPLPFPHALLPPLVSSLLTPHSPSPHSTPLHSSRHNTPPRHPSYVSRNRDTSASSMPPSRTRSSHGHPDPAGPGHRKTPPGPRLPSMRGIGAAPALTPAMPPRVMPHVLEISAPGDAGPAQQRRSRWKGMSFAPMLAGRAAGNAIRRLQMRQGEMRGFTPDSLVTTSSSSVPPSGASSRVVSGRQQSLPLSRHGSVASAKHSDGHPSHPAEDPSRGAFSLDRCGGSVTLTPGE